MLHGQTIVEFADQPRAFFDAQRLRDWAQRAGFPVNHRQRRQIDRAAGDSERLSYRNAQLIGSAKQAGFGECNSKG